MAVSDKTYYKPDVEVEQQFRNLSPTVLKATLQACIVGPAYQIIEKERVGTYLGDNDIAQTFPYPVSLLPDSEMDLDTFVVEVTNYEGDNAITRSVVRHQGNSATFVPPEDPPLVAFPNGYVEDLNASFENYEIVPSTTAGDHDGDYFRVINTDFAGYYEILGIVDHPDQVNFPGVKVLKLDAPIQNGVTGDPPEPVYPGTVELEYVIASFGYLHLGGDAGIQIAPRLTSSGTVKVSLKALRKDYTQRLVIANTIEDLESFFKTEITPENPLAYGMAKALASLGANDVICGIMVESETEFGYAKALEYLETEDVYCLVPLSQEPIIHQLFAAHVTKMSAPEEKMERVCLLNTKFMNHIEKVGYYKLLNDETGIYDSNRGVITHSGTPPNVIMDYNHHTFNFAGVGVDQDWVPPNDIERVIIQCRVPETSFAATVTTSGVPGHLPDPILPTTVDVDLDGDGMFFYQAPPDETIALVTFTPSALADDKFEAFGAKTTGLADDSESEGYRYVRLSPTGVQMLDPNPEVEEGVSYAIQIRHFDASTGQSQEQVDADVLANYMSGPLPGGMHIIVTSGEEQKVITEAGFYSFPLSISHIHVTNSLGLDGAMTDLNLIEMTLMTQNQIGEYSMDRFIAEDGWFLSADVIPLDELVITEGPNAGTYVIEEVVSESELIIASQFPIEQEVMFDVNGVALEDAEGNPLKVPYKVQSAQIEDKNLLAELYKGISEGFNCRRVIHIYAPFVGIEDENGELLGIPGYYFACAYAGVTQAERPEYGFTNRPIPGFSRVFFTNDFFTERLLNIIASGGTSIVIQHRALAPLSVRHQLTTDMISIETKEYSVTKNVDHMAKTARLSFRPYIGRFLINDVTMTTLYSLGNALVRKWVKDGQLISGNVTKFYVDPEQADKVLACFYIKPPIPLNYIRLIFVI